MYIKERDPDIKENKFVLNSELPCLYFNFCPTSKRFSHSSTSSHNSGPGRCNLAPNDSNDNNGDKSPVDRLAGRLPRSCHGSYFLC